MFTNYFNSFNYKRVSPFDRPKIMTESMILLHRHTIFSKTMSFKHQFILSVYFNSRLNNCSLKFSFFCILLNRTGLLHWPYAVTGVCTGRAWLAMTSFYKLMQFETQTQKYRIYKSSSFKTLLHFPCKGKSSFHSRNGTVTRREMSQIDYSFIRHKLNLRSRF